MDVPAVVPHLPVPILELICNELAADVSRLGRVLVALRSAAPSSKLGDILAAEAAVTPSVKCKHGLREDWCAICKAYNDCVDSRGTAKPYKQSKNRKKDHIKRGVLYPSERIPQEDTITPGSDTLWNIVPACELHHWCGPNHCEQGSAHCPHRVRFNQVTPEDVAWCERQSTFPRLRVSAAGVARHEQKLFADVAAFAVRDAARVKEDRSLRPVTFRAARSPKWRTQSAMGKLLSLYEDVIEKMRGDEEADHCANIEEWSYKQSLRYLRACQRWLVEKNAGKQARPLKDILRKSCTFPN
jgi:hypothetical protein